MSVGLLRNVKVDSWFSSEYVFPEEDEEFSATLKAVRYARGLLGVADLQVPIEEAAFTGNGDSQRYYYLV